MSIFLEELVVGLGEGLPRESRRLDVELVEAARDGNATLARDLLARGADPAAEPVSCLLISGPGYTCRRLCSPPNYPGAKPSCWSRALLEASANGHLECVRILAPFVDGLRPAAHALAWAAYGGHAECVAFLLPLARPEDDLSVALTWASADGRSNCVELLLPFSNPTLNQSEPLRIAAERGHADCVKLLAPASGVDEHFFKALFHAASRGRAECVKILAPCCPASEKIQALFLGVHNNRPSVVSCLLSAPLAEQDFVGVDFLAHIDAARENESFDVSSLLAAFVERIALDSSVPAHAAAAARPRL